MTSRVGGVPSPALVDRAGCPAGIAMAIGAAALVAAAGLGAALTPAPAVRLAVLVLAVLVFAAVSGNTRAAAAVAALAWPIGNGFLVNRFGALSWHGRLDAGFLVGLLAAVAAGMTLARARRVPRTGPRARRSAELPRDNPKTRPVPVEPSPVGGRSLVAVGNGRRS